MGKTKFIKSKYIGIIEIDFLNDYDSVVSGIEYQEAKRNFKREINAKLKELLKENVDGDVKLTQKYADCFVIEREDG